MKPMAVSPEHPTALVLPGGGVRGAYEVGVIAGLVEVLGLRANDPAPFTLFTGSSVGAINAAYFGAQVHRGDLGIDDLAKMWVSLHLDLHLRWRLPRGFLRGRPDQVGWSFLDPRPLERLVKDSIDWPQLHKNAENGSLAGVIVTALDIATGTTAMFAEVGRGRVFRPSRDPSRSALPSLLGPEHILASAAFPGLFPAQRIGEHYYVDGGIRFNTPIAPAIRAGAQRLVIVPTLFRRQQPRSVIKGYPSATFFLGKLVNALIADSLDYDLQVLDRFNRLVGAIDSVIDQNERADIDRALLDTRGTSYRKLDTLVIRPSQDVGSIAGEHIRTRLQGSKGFWFKQLLKRSGSDEADWASYVLFDGLFAERLIELGRGDSLARADEIRRFFAL